MAQFKPEFPFKGNQVILSSDRVMLHSKSDAIFLFGKQAVSLSSTKTINLDASEKILFDAPIVELGNQAQSLGQPVILGWSYNREMVLFLTNIGYAASLLAQVSESNVGSSMEAIARAGQLMVKECRRLGGILNQPTGPTLSKNTFTR